MQADVQVGRNRPYTYVQHSHCRHTAGQISKLYKILNSMHSFFERGIGCHLTVEIQPNFSIACFSNYLLYPPVNEATKSGSNVGRGLCT